MSDRQPFLIIVGWDGATPELLERFADAGALPTVASAMKQGSYRRLRSTIPPVTACAWCSFLSGKNPGKHGLFDFVTPRKGTYQFDYTNGGYRGDRSSDFLRLLNRLGLRVGCVNVPMTYPPYEIDGFMISGLDAPDEKSGIAVPGDLFERAQAEVGPYRIDNRHLGSMKTNEDRRTTLEEFKRIETRRTDITLAMMRHCPVDALIIIYNATDQVQHHFWHLMDAQHPAHRAGSDEVALFRDSIQEVYEHCDHELSRLLDACPDADWMLVSDHGAGPTSGPRVRLNNALAKAGLLTWAAPKGGIIANTISKFDQVLRRTLSAKQKAFLSRVIPGGRTKLESMSLPAIDWSKTIAFAYEGFTLSPCIWINRKSRFPAGTVGNGAEYERACARVSECLLGLRHPITNRQVIPGLYSSSGIYSGAFSDAAPDLILDWWSGEPFTITKSHPKWDAESPVLETLRTIEPGQDISGIHRRDGVLVAAGPHFQNQHNHLDSADLIDIAPTVMASMGQSPPPDMDGRVLDDIIAGAITVDPHCEPAANPRLGAAEPTTIAYSDSERELIEKRLSSLGYLE